MTKIDIFSGFLGAGKTTLIKKLLKEAYNGERVVLIENEFGEIGIDSGFLKESGIEITEMNSGCICCSLVGDFGEALSKVITQFSPDRILIEPSGVGKLSDVILATKKVVGGDVVLNSFTTVADANKCKIYSKNFGEFYNDQIENAGTIILSRTAGINDEKLEKCVELLREHNKTATIITTPWEDLDGKDILSAIEKKNTLDSHIEQLLEEYNEEHDECDDPNCCCHHHHDHDEHEHHHEHDHHHHDHDECECEHHHHHHNEDEHHHEHECEHHHEHHHECECEHHHHEHEHHHHDHECEHHHHEHNHHHADDVFGSWGKETIKKFTVDSIKNILTELDSGKYGAILRAKGIVSDEDGKWIHFDYVPGEHNVRNGQADIIGRLCVIGAKLDEDALSSLFGLN